MLNKMLKLVSLTGMLLSGIGVLVICISPRLGLGLTERWLREVESVESDLYHLILQNYILAFLMIGGIFLSVGLTTTMYCFYKSRLFALDERRTF